MKNSFSREGRYNPHIYRNDGLGTNIVIIDLNIGIDDNDLQELNEEINEKGIFVYSESVGSGGPGDIFATPELIETVKIIIGEIVVNIFASYTYDVIKNTIKKTIKKIREKKGEPKIIGYDIEHNNSYFILIVREGVVDEDILDLSLRNLLSQVRLKEEPIPSVDDFKEGKGVG